MPTITCHTPIVNAISQGVERLNKLFSQPDAHAASVNAQNDHSAEESNAHRNPQHQRQRFMHFMRINRGGNSLNGRSSTDSATALLSITLQPEQNLDAEQMHIAMKYADELLAKMVPAIAGIGPNLWETLEASAQRFCKPDNSVMLRYLFNVEGQSASLEGPAPDSPATKTEFQKTIASYLLFKLHHACKIDVFLSPELSLLDDTDDKRQLAQSLSNGYRKAIESAMVQFKGKFKEEEGPFPAILAVHNVMKSHDMSDRIGQALKDNPLAIPDLPHCSPDTFAHLDHDEKLLVALHLMEREFEEGKEAIPGALTMLFFHDQAITSGDAAETVKLMKDMWEFRLNGKQIIQAESRPRQLQPFLEKMLSAPDDAAYAGLKAAFKALVVHETTELMGVGAPNLPVFHHAMVRDLLQLFEGLEAYVDELRDNQKSTSIDVTKAAQRFFLGQLPKFRADGLDKIETELQCSGQEATKTKILVKSLASMCALEKDEEKSLSILLPALKKLKEIDAEAYQALLDTYGNRKSEIFMSYAAALLGDVKSKINKDEQGTPRQWQAEDATRLCKALHLLGRAAHFCRTIVEDAGGPAGFRETYGTESINIRQFCQQMLDYMGDEQDLDPATLVFRLSGNSLSICTRGHALAKAARDNQFDTVSELLDLSDLDPDVKIRFNGVERTPLGWAARYGNTAIVKLLIERGADPNAKENEKDGGWTPLFYAIYNGYADLFSALCEHGVDLSVTGESGMISALVLAAQRGNLSIVKYLVEHAGLPPEGLPQHASAISFAVRLGHTDVAEYLAGKEEERLSEIMLAEMSKAPPLHEALLKWFPKCDQAAWEQIEKEYPVGSRCLSRLLAHHAEITDDYAQASTKRQKELKYRLNELLYGIETKWKETSPEASNLIIRDIMRLFVKAVEKQDASIVWYPLISMIYRGRRANMVLIEPFEQRHLYETAKDKNEQLPEDKKLPLPDLDGFCFRVSLKWLFCTLTKAPFKYRKLNVVSTAQKQKHYQDEMDTKTVGAWSDLSRFLEAKLPSEVEADIISEWTKEFKDADRTPHRNEIAAEQRLPWRPVTYFATRTLADGEGAKVGIRRKDEKGGHSLTVAGGKDGGVFDGNGGKYDHYGTSLGSDLERLYDNDPYFADAEYNIVPFRKN